jgi:predicted signal transduction protein with EAL and GGDEF domain
VGHVTASLGIATFPQHASSRDTLVLAADRALYDAKNSGRNCVCVPPDDSPGGIFEDGEIAEIAHAEAFPADNEEASDSSFIIS